MSVEDRLARLERENRRLKLAGLLVLAIIGSVFVTGQVRPPAVVEAQRFVVKNSRGAEVASLSALYADGEPTGTWLAFIDYKSDGGQSVGTFFQGGGGQEGVLQLNMESGKRIVRLRTGYADLDPSISISTPSGAQWNAP